MQDNIIQHMCINIHIYMHTVFYMCRAPGLGSGPGRLGWGVGGWGMVPAGPAPCKI